MTSMFGVLHQSIMIGVPIQLGDGVGQAMDGTGNHMSHSAGQHIIMEGGTMMTTMAGCGHPDMNGALRG